MPCPSRAGEDDTTDPRRDLDQHPAQTRRHQEVDQSSGRGDAEIRGAARGEKDAQGGDEDERLGHLDAERTGEGPPPQPGQSLALRQRVADQAERRGDDQQDDEGEATDVGGQHDRRPARRRPRPRAR